MHFRAVVAHVVQMVMWRIGFGAFRRAYSLLMVSRASRIPQSIAWFFAACRHGWIRDVFSIMESWSAMSDHVKAFFSYVDTARMIISMWLDPSSLWKVRCDHVRRTDSVGSGFSVGGGGCVDSVGVCSFYRVLNHCR